MNTDMNPVPNRLKRAVDSQATPQNLESRIRARLREADVAEAPSHTRWVWPALAPLAVAALAGVFWVRQAADTHIPSLDEQRSYIERVSGNVTSLMRAGLGDHIHCALFRKHPAGGQAPALPAQYAGLLDAAKRHAPRGYQVKLAHQCAFGKRLFVHLVMKKDRDLISLVLSTRGEGEAFDAKGLVQGLKASGIPFYAEDAVDFRVAAFEAKNHFVYVISSMPAQANTELLVAMADDVRQALPGI